MGVGEEVCNVVEGTLAGPLLAGSAELSPPVPILLVVITHTAPGPPTSAR